MTYPKVGGEVSTSETVVTLIVALPCVFIGMVLFWPLGIMWAQFRWSFMRGMYAYAKLDEQRAKADGETQEFAE